MGQRDSTCPLSSLLKTWRDQSVELLELGLEETFVTRGISILLPLIVGVPLWLRHGPFFSARLLLHNFLHDHHGNLFEMCFGFDHVHSFDSSQDLVGH